MAGMKEQLEALYELQEIDTTIADRTKSLAALDDGTGADAELKTARKKLAAMEKRKTEIEGAYKDRELRLQSTEEDLKKRSKQAYDGLVTDPKQLRALQQKIEELQRQETKIEEDLLKLLETTEKAEKAIAKQGKLVTELEGKAGSTHDQHSSETERLRAELADLATRRDQLAGEVSETLMKQYEHLRGKPDLEGLAVSAVRLGTCTGCRVGVPSMYAPRLRDRSELVRCESCRRILYLPDGESPFAPVDDD